MKTNNRKTQKRVSEMAAVELEAYAAGLKALPESEWRPLTRGGAMLLARARLPGRPPKAAADRVVRRPIAFEPALLEAADAHVRRIGQTRSGWIRELIRAALAAETRRRARAGKRGRAA